MRKVQMTKQQTVRPNEKMFGLTVKQIIGIAIGGVIVTATLVILLFVLKLPTELVMTLVFLEVVATALISIVRVNGMSLVKHFIVCMKGPINRPYQSKGAKHYEENDE